jgi:uroporphyrinogen III methyltransferase/synthase
VVVTRPREQALALVHALTEAGADAVALPCLRIEPPEDPEALRSALARVPADFDGVLISSPAGARALAGALGSLALDARLFHGKRVAAVGPGTAQALRERGIVPDLVSTAPRSEGVVQAMRDRGMLAARWLHVRGDEGRDTVAAAVAEAGGRYELAVAYRVVRPELDAATVRSLLPADQGGEGLDAVVIGSGRAAELLLEGLEAQLGADGTRTLLGRARIVSLGPVTSAAVERLGLKVAATATDPSDEALIAATVAALA